MKYLALISFVFGSCVVCAALFSAGQSAGQTSVPVLVHAIDSAMGKTGGAALVLDIVSDQIVAAKNLQMSARVLATPGSTLKPFFLLAALQDGAMPEQERVYCRRSLRVAGRPMNCVHPAIAHALDAREALAYSCNTYFAELAGRIYSQRGGEGTAAVLRSRGIDQSSKLVAGAVRGMVRAPSSAAQAQLLALGVEGVEVSPLALAEAYRSLALEITRTDATPAAHTVATALEDSVRYGMADEARVSGLRIAGKTGTASAEETGATHGWFVGYAPADKPRVLVLIYLPHGRGADAARIAGTIFAAWTGHGA